MATGNEETIWRRIEGIERFCTIVDDIASKAEQRQLMADQFTG